ncbi:hypothetical protein TanjilG_02594 [Lupinus angustifolius]|uniref:Protein kinase domain-containing protein n=1 Tax=Lupinus angustifolius TaxID=3871 RepID=A0A4P1R8L7_LUPAN|nr:PREDICTED: leucine-rich repeat receptor-like protein kinase PXC1 [Lupinus angustifolius]OIW05121.1 hypothetical protein TanjilG_02594 [Lupinus angustifolius]
MHLTLVLTLVLAFLCFTQSQAQNNNDTNALTQFHLQTDAYGYLLPNWTGFDACAAAWRGVTCSPNGRVIELSLPSLNLQGPIHSLSTLSYLRFLDLHDNHLNGTVAPLSNCTSLELLYLSGNNFSGEIPPEISSLKLLLRLDISNNNINGSLPKELSRLTHLLTLRLQNNDLSGNVIDLSSSLVNLTELNFTNNELHGYLPDSMFNKFGNASFFGNDGLCGSPPLPFCHISPSPESNKTFSSHPSSLPQTSVLVPSSSKAQQRKWLSPGAIVGIVVAIPVVLMVVISFIIVQCCDREKESSMMGSESGKRKSGSSGSGSSEKRVYNNNNGVVVGDKDRDSDGTNATENNEKTKLVFFDRGNVFELEDLLRASAEMLGKGGLGTVYRAVVDEGVTVAVKRLKDTNPFERVEFEQYMNVVGKVKHPNVVRLRAYYYAKEEKLLVYDYLPNGSLHALLHGNRGPGRIPLDWTTRMSIVLGAAKGLARIHAEYSAAKIPHGNIKSSNVLLDKNGVACISDFGLSLLLNPIQAIARLGAYKAPEQEELKTLSQEADVYSFGVLVLEVLTGKAPSKFHNSTSNRAPRVELEEEDVNVDLPKWVRAVVKEEEWTKEVFDQELLRYKNIEEEMVAMMNVGLACVVPQPEMRPNMFEIAKMVEDMRVEQSPLREYYDESRTSLSPSLVTTEDGLTKE